ncbi:glycosyltransferase [Macrococcoides canis]|uniref:Glycosyltransferase n=1 Tax=Macrococcoides canis TaxID=1855823 RepID=A0AAE6X066_9STAP|nr:glycosyltransferase family 4 protein [Macrococcus canis]QIH77986.1 glycosyltransferase [Macrococcus canis]
MNIIVFSQYYEPEPFLIHDKMKRLVELGHDVTVVTGLPNYPKGELISGYNPGVYDIDGVKVIRLNVRPRRNGSKNLFLNYCSYAYKASKYTKNLKSNYDVIYVYQLSPVLMAIPAIALKKRIKKPIVLYCLDLWPESLVLRGIKKNSIIYKIFKLISKKIYTSVDLIEISSKSFEKYFNNVLKIKKNMIYNPQYSIEGETKEIETDINFLKDYVNITFTGNIGQIQGLEVAIHAMIKVKNKVILHIVGDGSNKEKLVELAERLEVDHRVIFHGRKPIEHMKSVMDKSDALLVTMKADEVISYTLPAKVQSYLNSGKFILGSIDGEAADVIRKSKAGLVSSAGNAIDLAKNIDEFVNKYDYYFKQGQQGIKYYNENFGKEKFIQILLNDLQEVIE